MSLSGSYRTVLFITVHSSYHTIHRLQNVHLRKHALIHHDLRQNTTMDRIGKAALYLQFRQTLIPNALGVCAAHAALKEHEEWLSDGFNAALVCPGGTAKAKAPVKLGETAAVMLTG